MGAVVNELANRQIEALEQRDRQERWRTTMVDALAHDVRSPLNLVRGVLETVIAHDDELDADGRRRLLAAADRHAARIEDLTADLLAAERVRDDRLRLDRQEVAVADLVERVRTIHDQDIDVQVGPGVTATVDPARMVQVLHNLLTNAHAHGSPPVEVTAARRGQGIVLEVRDHGPGVPDSGRDLATSRARVVLLPREH